MYINFWYPIVRSEDLGDQPYKTKVLGVDLVAFRGKDGKPAVLSDTCTHRGGSLGGGWAAGDAPRIIDGCIVCPYHGWEFNSDGDCVNIPSIGYNKKTPARAKVDAYPTQEKYGIVFAFLGDLPEEERPPLLEIDEDVDDAWRQNSVLVLEVPFYYQRSVENGLDPAHNEFVHPTHGFSGINRETYHVRHIPISDYEKGYGFWFSHKFNAPALDEENWGDTRTEEGDLVVEGGTYGPNVIMTYINPAPDAAFRQYFYEAPIDEKSTRIFFINNRNFMLDPSMDGPIHARNKVIAGQDIEVMSHVTPQQTPLNSRIKEVLTPSDAPIIAYRSWLDKFTKNGWQVDLKAFNEEHGQTKAFAIPCPARRTSKNWALDPLPLIPGENAATFEAAADEEF